MTVVASCCTATGFSLPSWNLARLVATLPSSSSSSPFPSAESPFPSLLSAPSAATSFSPPPLALLPLLLPPAVTVAVVVVVGVVDSVVVAVVGVVPVAPRVEPVSETASLTLPQHFSPPHTEDAVSDVHSADAQLSMPSEPIPVPSVRVSEASLMLPVSDVAADGLDPPSDDGLCVADDDDTEVALDEVPLLPR